MSKFYSFTWVLFFVSAGVMWLADVLNMFAVLVFGFIAFGLVFAGMMCVLPSAVSHPVPTKIRMPEPEKGIKEVSAKVASSFSAYGSA